jgi:hypothetical protein
MSTQAPARECCCLIVPEPSRPDARQYESEGGQSAITQPLMPFDDSEFGESGAYAGCSKCLSKTRLSPLAAAGRRINAENTEQPNATQMFLAVQNPHGSRLAYVTRDGESTAKVCVCGAHFYALKVTRLCRRRAPAEGMASPPGECGRTTTSPKQNSRRDARTLRCHAFHFAAWSVLRFSVGATSHIA